jgi:hypothetical protein
MLNPIDSAPKRSWDTDLRRSSRLRQSAGGPVQNLVALPAKRDQVGFCVLTKGAAPSHVVNIEMPRGSALLAAPTILLQDFVTQPRI